MGLMCGLLHCSRAGLVVLPLQRYRLQSELSTKVDELSLSLDLALSSQLEIEAQVLLPLPPFRCFCPSS